MLPRILIRVGQGFYFYQNLPLRWVRIVGVVVGIDEFYGRRVFTVDDSSGACIETTASYTPISSKLETSASTTEYVPKVNPKNAEASEAKDTVPAKGKDGEAKATLPFEDLDVGHVVDVKGRLSTFRDEIQIEILRLTMLRSTQQEIALWERRATFRHEVLEKPWVLTERQIRRCRKEAEPEEDKAAKKRRRLKAAMEAASSRPTGKQKRQSDKENSFLEGVNV